MTSLLVWQLCLCAVMCDGGGAVEGSWVSVIDMLACLAATIVNMVLGVPFCFSSTLAIWPWTVAVIVAFS